MKDAVIAALLVLVACDGVTIALLLDIDAALRDRDRDEPPGVA